MNNETRNSGNRESPEGRYSNYVEVGFNAFEFLFEFAQMYSDSELSHAHTKIVMSPYYAKNLLETLQKSILQYEADYGPVVKTETEIEGASTEGVVAAVPSLARKMAAAPVAVAGRPVAGPVMAMGSSQQVHDAVKALLDVLKTYLPPAGGGVPAPSVFISSITERRLGLNNCRGEDTRAGFGVVELRGGRLDAVARFELWAAQPGAVEQAIQDLITRLLADRDMLWTVGFLRIALEGTSTCENVPALPAWRQTADVRVLYEFHFEGSDDSQGLIARIPIHIDSTYHESTTVTDEMARWDNQEAHSLLVRGPATISALSCLVFIAGAAPGRSVTLTRTFDGAASPPTQYGTLAAFLAGISGPNAQRNAQLVFASWTHFMAIFQPDGASVTLGADSYSPFKAALSPAITLGGPMDFFEIAYQSSALEVKAVAYLRSK